MLTGATSAFSLPGLSDPPAKPILPSGAIHSTPAEKAALSRDFGRLPLSFESNQGQTNSKVRFLTHSGDSTLFLTPSEAVFSMTTPPVPSTGKKTTLRKDRKADRAAAKIARVALRMQMVGANPKASTLTQQPLAGRINYFLGKDPSKWHSGVPTFERVGFHGVYPGIDLVYYGSQKHLEYDFLVAPHADPKQIQLHFAGAQSVHIDAAGDLLIHTQGRELKWQKPIVYQQDSAGKHPVAAHFQRTRMSNGQTGIRFALGHYNADRPLVIDPVLLYSTYLGGTGAYGDRANAIAVDNSGNAYITGLTTSLTFPTTAGAFQTVNVTGGRGGWVAFISKLNPTGTALVYSTYLGGTSGRDVTSGIAVDADGNAYVTGSTASGDFPTTPGVFQLTNHTKVLNNAFVTKLNATGTALVYSTYLGGSSIDQAYGIAIDSSGSAYVAGSSSSPDFPITAGAFQQTEKGGANSTSAFVSKLNSTGTTLLYSTYLGGSQGGDTGVGIAVDNNGNAFVTGITFSSNFPTTPTAFQATYPAGIYSPTSFVTKLNSTGTDLVYSTYLGGSTSVGDEAKGIAIDNSGNAYVVGQVYSTDFPTTPGAFQSARNSDLGSTNAFVTKLNSTGTALLYSTYLGGGGGYGGDVATAIAVDSQGDAYVAGSTPNSRFPTTPGAFQRVNGSRSPQSAGTATLNAFVTKLSPTGATLLYSTFLGGTNGSGAAAVGIGIDPHGNAYVVGNSTASDFPTTPGAFQPGNGAVGGNAFVTKLSPVRILPDFNKDGSTDLLIQNSSTNQIASWFMQGPNWVGGAYFSLTPLSDYTLIGTGDFSGDGKTTLVFQSRKTNQIVFWDTSGTDLAAISSSPIVDTTPVSGWKVVGIGDFNGDGKSDLVFQNQTTNAIALWYMNGSHVQSGDSLAYIPPVGWKVVGVGDFNADGASDLVFQDQATGKIAIWFMFGKNYLDGIVLTTIPFSNWKAVGVGDYNGDGYADLLFQNQTTNQGVVWYLQNGAYVDGSSLSLYPPFGWKIVGPR
ncbi:MAG: hypothetical protein JWL77_1080 [Chthonomonadaceae bacterium]|nr:hypothetical protein [Chthonomonadaceae bacterium]